MPACIAPSIPRLAVGEKRRSRNRFGALIDASKDLFQVCHLLREAEKIVHQIWWDTGDAVCTSHRLPPSRDVT